MFKEDQIKALAGTTVAVDLIKGGVKANALPERAWAVVNHRIAVERSVSSQDLPYRCRLLIAGKPLQLRWCSQGIRHRPS